ncbi:hypothetical protein OAC18_00345 [Flavobacteriaceae bacterium]|nr:hypothetical protein [Flavobacteriaceae bacterium]MDB4130733.1 hypothetical protein [Flavobacteriaceae bacterium]MDB9827446.1 hypothetical protein [Flavobacteriaceae bacterium]MDC0106183.1 hypothetical protein [Flavobacteriaceae bacterium]MDC1417105.1 hypothetical protein [Flavobacteriaceae bacterium]
MVNLSKENFNNLVKNPNNINLDQSILIKKIIKKYPYFQTARIIELIGLKKFNNIRFNNALKTSSIYSTDRSVLFDIIELEKIKSEDNSTILSLEKTKNSFIDWLNASKQTKNPEYSQNSLIESFLKVNPKIDPKKNIARDDLSSDFKLSNKEYMTETLAKIYFNQNKFEEAIRAYEILSLKYPEKISLFADQIKTIKSSIKNKMS